MTVTTTQAAPTDLDDALASFHPVSATPIGVAAYRARLAALRTEVRAAGLAAIWLDGSSSLTYFTGLRLGQSERIHGALVAAEGPPAYLTPAFEAPKLDALRQIPGPMLMWEERYLP